MRKPHYIIFFLLVLIGKLAFAGSSVQSLFDHRNTTHVAHHSEVTCYFASTVVDQPVELEEDLLEKTKKHYLSLCELPENNFVFRLQSNPRILSLSGPDRRVQTGDLVILHRRILI
ncbi:MAG: hypothetical protein EOO05_21850 [Chitinophagaceae bacterium]|nr:MAG: hypothetical protein EOO05_21850 [Chitinophagaceae bacterium]